ncbi:hypothetical protein D9M68_616790 [compost metagenome]
MRAVYLDTEFTCLRIDRSLISLALVDSAGAEFYVELTDGWSPHDCSEFVQTVVLPQLDHAQYGMTIQNARKAVRSFLEGLGQVEIVGDALRWDWPLLLELLGPTGLPSNVVGCREVSDCSSTELPDEVPHHALLDARMLCRLCESG